MDVKRDLSYFMREQEEEIVTFPAPESIGGGEPVMIEARVLDNKTISKIQASYRNKTPAKDDKGKFIFQGGRLAVIEEYDSQRGTDHIIVESLIFPNLKDKDLMDHYGVHDVTDMPTAVFYKRAEYEYIVQMILKINGIMEMGASDKEIIEEVKN